MCGDAGGLQDNVTKHCEACFWRGNRHIPLMSASCPVSSARAARVQTRDKTAMVLYLCQQAARQRGAMAMNILLRPSGAKAKSTIGALASTRLGPMSASAAVPTRGLRSSPRWQQASTRGSVGGVEEGTAGDKEKWEEAEEDDGRPESQKLGIFLFSSLVGTYLSSRDESQQQQQLHSEHLDVCCQEHILQCELPELPCHYFEASLCRGVLLYELPSLELEPVL